MENISFIQQIFVLQNQIYQLEKQKHNEIWSNFQEPLVLQIYKDLCNRIPETKSIMVQQLFNKSIHPAQNKEELLSKYANLKLNFNRMSKIQSLVNDFWVKLASIWTPIDVKYDKQLTEIRNQLMQLDNSTLLDQLLSKYDEIIKNSKSIADIERLIMNEDIQEMRENLYEILNSTRNILEIHYELQ